MRTLSVAAWLLVPACLWAAAAPEKDDKAVSPVETVRKVLDRPLTIKIGTETLDKVVEMLHEKTQLHFALDTLTIQQQLGFNLPGPPVAVQVDFKDVQTRNALRTILAPYGLSYAVIGDTVVVTTEDVAMLRQMRQRVSINLNKVELSAALKQIGRETATNLVLDSRADPEAKTAVSLQIEDVPLETAVRLLSEMAGLKPVRVGNTMFVTKKEIANEMRNDPDFAQQNQPIPSIYAQQGAVIGGVVGLPNPPPLPTLPPAPPTVGPAPVLPPTVPPGAGPTPTPPMGGTGGAPSSANEEKR